MSASRSGKGVDFLSRLVERASGAGVGVEPRLPSIFEPAPSSPIAPGDDAEPRAPAFSKDTEDAPANGVRSPPLRRQGESRDDAASTGQQGPRAVAASPVAPFERAERETETTQIETVRNLVPERSQESAPARVPSLRGGRTDEGQREPILAKPAALSFVLPVSSDLMRETDTEGPDREPPPLRTVGSERLSAGPESVARAAVASLGEALGERPRPEPRVVNVSIGRLEIRATQPARVPARTAGQSGVQPTSLGEYLKQNGGRR